MCIYLLSKQPIKVTIFMWCVHAFCMFSISFCFAIIVWFIVLFYVSIYSMRSKMWCIWIILLFKAFIPWLHSLFKAKFVDWRSLDNFIIDFSKSSYNNAFNHCNPTDSAEFQSFSLDSARFWNDEREHTLFRFSSHEYIYHWQRIEKKESFGYACIWYNWRAMLSIFFICIFFDCC